MEQQGAQHTSVQRSARRWRGVRLVSAVIGGIVVVLSAANCWWSVSWGVSDRMVVVSNGCLFVLPVGERVLALNGPNLYEAAGRTASVGATARSTPWLVSTPSITPRREVRCWRGGVAFLSDLPGRVTIPAWAAGTALIGAVFGFAWLKERRLARRVGNCHRCGYLLAGLPEGSRCPECGWHDLAWTG